MKSALNRRDFIRNLSLSGASIALSGSVMANSFHFGDASAGISNDYFTVSFEAGSGRFHVRRSNGDSLIAGGSPGINLPAGRRSISPAYYRSTVDSIPLKDELGSGRQLKISSKDLEKRVDIETRFSLYEGLQAVLIEVFARNVSSRDIPVYSLEPVSAHGNEGGGLHLPGVSRCLTNGAMYYDAGMLHTFGTPYKKPEPYGETKGGRLSRQAIPSGHETVLSWWNAGFFSGYDKEGLVLGYIENKSGLGQLLLTKAGEGLLSFVAESVFAPGFVLKPGQRISSGRFMANIASGPYEALEDYAGLMGLVNKARTHSIVNGWCNWFYTYGDITEEEVIRNAEFASRHLRPYGFEYIQVDEGFQRWHGDWEGNERFPHGMKWLAGKIREYGLKAGLWLAPYVVSEPTELFRKNPDWFLKNPDGSPKRVGPWPDEDTDWARNENPRRYGLDITHPGAAAWLHGLMDTVGNQWGYEMAKIDFVAWSLLSAHRYYDPSVTPAQAYRKGFEIMRSALGESCHLLDCGPAPVSCGLADSMRIELDQNYGYAGQAWKQYFQDSSCSAAAAAKRYYFHKRAWANDADHICINLLSNPQAQAVATIIALSGGNAISGDRLTELSAEKLEILKKALPAYGQAARPVNLFDSDIPTAFALKIQRDFAEWTVAGFFNPDTNETMEQAFPLERLFLEPGKAYLAYDFWMEKFIGEFSDSITVKIQPGSVTLLALHEKSGAPQFISTNRHVSQGAVELERISWNPETKTLNGVSLGPLNTAHCVSVYLPEPYPWRMGGFTLFQDFDSYSLNMVHDNIMRVYVRFERSTRVEWEIKCGEMGG